MRDKDVFEKAKMNGVLIPLAGFIAAAALILAAVMIPACFGAYTRLTDKEDEQSAVFEEPEISSYDYGIETVNEHPEVTVEIRILEFTSSETGEVSYKFDLVNNGDTAANIKDVRCMIYDKDKCIKSSTLSDQISLMTRSDTEISGKEQTDGADTVIFYVSWQDENGAAADTYAVCKKK